MRTRSIALLPVVIGVACAPTPDSGGYDARTAGTDAAQLDPSVAVDGPSPTPVDALTRLDGHAWRLDADGADLVGICAGKPQIFLYYTLTFSPDGTSLSAAGVQLDVFDHFDADLVDSSDLRRTYRHAAYPALTVQVWLENGVAYAAVDDGVECEQGTLTLE